MICKYRLLKSIQAVHLSVISCANCICNDINEQEKEFLLDLGLELSKQLAALRNFYIEHYDADPITGAK